MRLSTGANRAARRDGRVAEGARLESVYTFAGIGGSNPTLSAITFGSSPETWVTECTGHMGNTFGPKGFSSGSRTLVSKSK